MSEHVNSGKLTKKYNTYERYYPKGTKRREERQEYMRLYMRKVREKAKKKRGNGDEQPS